MGSLPQTVKQQQPDLRQRLAQPQLISKRPLVQMKRLPYPPQQFRILRPVRIQCQHFSLRRRHQRQNIHFLNSAAPLPGKKRRIKYMQRLNRFLRRLHGLCRMQHIGIEHSPASCRKRPDPVWRTVLKRSAFHIKNLHCPVPVPRHTPPNVCIDPCARRNIRKFFRKPRQKFLLASLMKLNVTYLFHRTLYTRFSSSPFAFREKKHVSPFCIRISRCFKSSSKICSVFTRYAR